MDGDIESSSFPPEVIQPEADFAEFFHGVISKQYDLKNRQILNNVKSALRYMRREKNLTDNFHQKTHSSYKRPQVRCAYLYAYSVLHCMMVYFEFSNLLKQSKTFQTFSKAMQTSCRKDTLKICCLGGGPGIEAVAICKSMYDTVLRPYLWNHNSLSVHVTMIDTQPHWKREESSLVNAINDSSNVLHSKRIILHSDFMKADLLKPFEESLRKKITEADIVTVSKLAASIQENNQESCDGELQIMMENIVDSMRKDSCLFMLDTGAGEVFNNMVQYLRDKGPCSRLKTSLHKEYNLDLSTIKKFEGMMRSKNDPNYRPVLPTVKGKLSACMWVKDISKFSGKSDVSNKNNVGKTSNVTNTVCLSVESEKDASSASSSHSSTDLETLNDNAQVTSDTAKSTEPQKKSKLAMRKEMKRKANKQTLSMIVSMIILTMILRRHSLID